MTTAKTASDLVLEIRIEAPPEDVFPLLVDPQKIIQWMGHSIISHGTVGSEYRWDIKGDGTAVAVGKIIESDPPKRLVFSWGWQGMEEVPPGSTNVTLDLIADGSATDLTLTHSGLPMGSDDQHKEGWCHFLGRLQIVGAGGDPGPDSMVAAQAM